METKGIEQALMASFGGYEGQIPLFLVLQFLANREKEVMITQRLVTLYTHQKLFANRRLSYHSYPRLHPRLVFLETPSRVPAFAIQAAATRI
jgi:hypothetical protein